MSNTELSAMCGQFGDSDDMEDNDEELGALGSILSWDDEADEAGLKQSIPPDTVEFSNNQDGTYTYSRNAESNNESLKLQLPLPTPISGLQAQASAALTPVACQAQHLQAPKPVVPQQQQQQASLQAQQQALQASFAQLLAQQAGIFQQQQQGQQAQRAQADGQSQPLPLRPAIPAQMSALQMQAPQQQQQQVQLPFSADPNVFLQQLQLAQLQLQIQAAQQQANAAQIPNVAAVQQQLQAHFAQAQAAANAQAAPAALAAPAAAPKPAPKRKAPPKSTAKLPPKPPPAGGGSSSALGTVSASDTDGEIYGRQEVLSSIPTKKLKLEEAVDTSHLTPTEKANVNRDRNREHAKNTRLRKKAYLEKLKTTVDDLCRERDTLVSERATAANLLVEMHNTRTEVLMSFFALRSSNEKRRKLWSSILDESSFTCVMPVTPYRSFPASEVQLSKCLRTIMGIDGMIADTSSLHVLFDSLVDRTKYPYGKIEFRYTLVTEDTVVAGNQMMARWIMTTTTAVSCGAKMEVAKQGMLCCKFNSAHKITRIEIMFDVMAFMLQLKQAAGSDGFSVVPNTVQTCQRSFDKPMVLTLVEPPYTIIQVNKLWEDMTGYSADEVVGKMSCNILQSDDTDKDNLETLMQEIRYKRPASAILVNKTKTDEVFTNFFVVFPLSTDSRITYYLGLTMHHERGTPVRPDDAPPVPPGRIQLQKIEMNEETKMRVKSLSPV